MNMTNYEKFKNEIEAFGYDFGVTKTQEIFFCLTMKCADCIFKDSCASSKVRWLYEEAKEIFPITPQEKDFLSILVGDNYIARDNNGQLFVYSTKPKQISDCWIAEDEGMIVNMVEIRSDFFKFITWESDNCWSVAELLKMPVKK